MLPTVVWCLFLGRQRSCASQDTQYSKRKINEFIQRDTINQYNYFLELLPYLQQPWLLMSKNRFQLPAQVCYVHNCADAIWKVVRAGEIETHSPILCIRLGGRP